MKPSSAATTILGLLVYPTVVILQDRQTLAAPSIDATIAIISGLIAKRLAVAAGMIRSAVMSRTPTIFIEMAITAAIKTMKKVCPVWFQTSATAIS